METETTHLALTLPDGRYFILSLQPENDTHDRIILTTNAPPLGLDCQLYSGPVTKNAR